MSKRDFAIDLGTANTLVYQQGTGIVFDEPSLVALDPRTGAVQAVGREVAEMAADGPGAVVTGRPLHRGVITDFEMTVQMMRAILRRLGTGRFARPRTLVCVSSILTPVERRAMEEAVIEAGAASATLVESSLAGAIGAGLPIQDPVGSLIVDVGGGMSEMAMVAMGGIVTSLSIKVGGFDMDAAIQQNVRRRYGIAIGDVVAERVKVEIGSAYPAADARRIEVAGRELSTGMPRDVTITPEEVREILGDAVGLIAETTRQCLSESPPELAHDILETGLFLSGGGGMLRGLDMRLAQECEVPVQLTERPLTTVVEGAGQLLEYLPEYRATFFAGHSRG
jgi:rod shape-determining protein MreB